MLTASLLAPIWSVADHRQWRTKRRWAAIGALSLVAAAGVAALLSTRGIDGQIADVVRSYEVRSQAHELAIAVNEAESSQRGYSLTGDAPFLASFDAARLALDRGLDRLTALTGRDTHQTDRVAAIGVDIDANAIELQRIIAGDSTADNGSGVDQRLMDGVRASLTTLIAAEDANLQRQNAAIENWRRWQVAFIILALAGAALLSVLLFSRTRQEMRVLGQAQSVLRSQNELLEKTVRERTADLDDARRHAEHERERVEALLHDTSHRIGNSLATVSSLLALQLIRSDKPEVKTALESARARVHAIASAHRRLRLGDDNETASTDEFLDAVLEDLQASSPDAQSIRVHGHIEPVLVSARDATTIGILVGELVTNAFKHAFQPGEIGTVTVRLSQANDNVARLQVTDTGCRLSPDAAMGEGGLGSVIVKQLAQQFGGKPVYQRTESGGLDVLIDLPGLALPATPLAS